MRLMTSILMAGFLVACGDKDAEDPPKGKNNQKNKKARQRKKEKFKRLQEREKSLGRRGATYTHNAQIAS